MHEKLKHICIISEEFPPDTGWGGIATYSFELSHMLTEKGINVSVIAVSKDNTTSVQKLNQCLTVYRLGKNSYSLINLPFFWRFNKYIHCFSFEVYRTIKNINKKSKIDLIESPEFRANSYFCQLFLREIPCIIRLHTSYQIISTMNNLPKTNKRFIKWEHQVIKLASNISSPSAALIDRTYLKCEAFKLKSARVIPNPISTTVFSNLNLVKKLKPSIIFVGRLEINKGIDVILDLLPELLTTLPNLHFTFVGNDGVNLKGVSYRKLIQEVFIKFNSSNFRFLVLDRKEVPYLVSIHQLLLMPSKWENFPYALLESMLVGTPALVNNIGGLSEIIKDGVNGWFFPDLIQSQLSDFIVSLLSNEKYLTQIGLSARESILNNYDSDKIYPEIISFYNENLRNLC
jgi:glycosyltransferase involved in cell wall biosynthesis